MPPNTINANRDGPVYCVDDNSKTVLTSSQSKRLMCGFFATINASPVARCICLLIQTPRFLFYVLVLYWIKGLGHLHLRSIPKSTLELFCFLLIICLLVILLVKILSDIENVKITWISTSAYHSYILVMREIFLEN